VGRLLGFFIELKPIDYYICKRDEEVENWKEPMIETLRSRHIELSHEVSVNLKSFLSSLGCTLL
jgi:hypothetical protein